VLKCIILIELLNTRMMSSAEMNPGVLDVYGADHQVNTTD